MYRITITKLKRALLTYEKALDIVNNNYDLKPESTFNYLEINNIDFGLCFYFRSTYAMDKEYISKYFNFDYGSFIARTPNSYHSFRINPSEGLIARIEFLKQFIKHHETITIKRTDY